jgi:hypothetical protein
MGERQVADRAQPRLQNPELVGVQAGGPLRVVGCTTADRRRDRVTTLRRGGLRNASSRRFLNASHRRRLPRRSRHVASWRLVRGAARAAVKERIGRFGSLMFPAATATACAILPDDRSPTG